MDTIIIAFCSLQFAIRIFHHILYVDNVFRIPPSHSRPCALFSFYLPISIYIDKWKRHKYINTHIHIYTMWDRDKERKKNGTRMNDKRNACSSSINNINNSSHQKQCSSESIFSKERMTLCILYLLECLNRNKKYDWIKKSASVIFSYWDGWNVLSVEGLQ